MKECSVVGCPRLHRADGLCSMHYQRKLRSKSKHWNQDPKPKFTPGDTHTVKIDRQGFRYRNDATHILANPTTHRVRLGRQVLYEQSTAPWVPCYWCKRALKWFGANRFNRVCADHCDDNPANDTPENLVASCPSCIMNRRRVDGFAEDVSPGRIDEVCQLMKNANSRTW